MKTKKPGDLYKKYKMTEAQDAQYDRKHGIKENSKRDIAQDKKMGVKSKMSAKGVKCKTCGKSHSKSVKHKEGKKHKFDTGLIKNTIAGIPAAANRLGRDTSKVLTNTALQVAAPTSGAYRSVREGVSDMGKAFRGQPASSPRTFYKRTAKRTKKHAKKS